MLNYETPYLSKKKLIYFIKYNSYKIQINKIS